MKLIVHELVTTLFQEVTPTSNTEVKAIRPHLLKHGDFVGNVSLQIRDMNDQVIASSSNSLNSAQMSSLDYAHKLYRFYIDASLTKDTPYRIHLVANDGYAFSDSVYVGWVNSFDLTKYEASYPDSEGMNAPLSLEIWERK